MRRVALKPQKLELTFLGHGGKKTALASFQKVAK
jgi:hypothetical protein